MSRAEFVAYSPDMAEELTAMWHRSFDHALAPFKDPKPIAARRHFLAETLVQRAMLTVAVSDHAIIGFMAQNEQTIEQLYVHVEHQREGLGARFMALAKAASPQRLHLHTFQRNLNARRFYRSQGFEEIGYGYMNMEGLADVELEWRPDRRTVSVPAKSSPGHR